jgi:parvulin-like peptidyl-prolyl isomerase
MELVRYKPCYGRLLMGVLLATLAAVPCAAQYPPENYPNNNLAVGNAPMGPAAPGGGLYQPAVPGPPPQPTVASRPSSWPGGGSTVAPQRVPASVLPPANELTPCEGTRILAHVGSEVILDTDVAGPVNDFLEANKARIPPEQLDATREFLVQKQLKNLVQQKLIFLDAKHSIPSEGWPQIEKQVNKVFEETELDRLMKRVGAKTRQDLDESLRKLGTSVEHERRAYFERELARQWIGTKIKRDDEITYDQMVTYYRQHLGEFSTPARVKWEELMTRSEKYPSEDAAYAALAQMGNQVFGGANLAELAKTASDGPTAYKGGAWDWTIQGSLVCQELDKALFNLPVGQLSRIIKEPNGFHIIRVTAREDARTTPFLEAQVDIREKIVKQRTDKQLREYLTKIEAHTPVATIFDGQGGPDGNGMLSKRPEGSEIRR